MHLPAQGQNDDDNNNNNSNNNNNNNNNDNNHNHNKIKQNKKNPTLKKFPIFKKVFLIFQEMELSSPELKMLLIFQEDTFRDEKKKL